MNKTWSIILIVVACIVVLGGTYWYFGMQKPKTQEEATPPAVVEPVKGQPPIAEDSPVISADTQEGTLPPKQTEISGAIPSTTEPVEKIQKDTLPAETSRLMNPLPAPIAPSISKGGGFSLPTLKPNSGEEVADKNSKTSVLASEELTTKTEANKLSPAVEEAAEVIEPQPVIENSAMHQELPDSATFTTPKDTTPENLQATTTDEVVLPAVAEKPVTSQPEEEQSIPLAAVVTPPTVKLLRSETALVEGQATEEKPTLEANLSVSFLDYNFTNDFSAQEKSFNVSLNVMNQKELFGWGGTLEVGKTDSKIVQVSLLAKTTWKLGKDKDVVTFPLSISLGPMLFIDSATNTTEFGMKAKLSAGVTYAISESFRMFYEVGVGATYNFQDSTSFTFVLEPIRIGVGFSF